jgi:predicted flap endonuclease-1-like 5' DNA nuclease
MDVLTNNWPIVLLVLVVLAILAFVLLRPRQRVQLSDTTPTRPHMQQSRPAEGRGIAGEAASATTDVAGEILEAPIHRALDGEGADDFTRMKGVGPKLANSLTGLGFNRFDQLATLSPNEIERLDERLGAFKGRLTRDRIIEQADYLSRNDVDGYEQKFGKL